MAWTDAARKAAAAKRKAKGMKSSAASRSSTQAVITLREMKSIARSPKKSTQKVKMMDGSTSTMKKRTAKFILVGKAGVARGTSTSMQFSDGSRVGGVPLQIRGGSGNLKFKPRRTKAKK